MMTFMYDMQSDPSDPYQIALFVCQKVSCVVSIIGSLMIVSQVCRNTFNRSKPRQRVILGISLCDIFASTAWLFTNVLMPPWANGMFHTVGNQATCDAQGFIIQSANSTGVMYMMILQIQYLLTINYGWKDKVICKWEPFMLGIPLCLGLGTAITALVLKLYNPAGWDCWIAPYPRDCTSSYQVNQGGTGLEETDCSRGDNAEIYQWAFFCGPLWGAIIFCMAILVSLVRSVKSTEQKALKWAIRNATNDDKRPILKHTKEVGIQSLMYAGAFFIVWTFPTITRIVELCGGKGHPLLFVLSGTFIASQGFFNAIIYFRPRYKKMKQGGMLSKVWSIVRSTLFFCCSREGVAPDKMDVVEETMTTKGETTASKTVWPSNQHSETNEQSKSEANGEAVLNASEVGCGASKSVELDGPEFVKV